MFKVIFRGLLILLIVAIVGAGIYTLVQNTSIGTLSGRGDFGGRTLTNQPATSASSGTFSAQNFQTARFREGGEGRFSFSPGRGLTGVLGNSILIVVITLAVVVVRKAMAPRLLRVRPVSLDRT